MSAPDADGLSVLLAAAGIDPAAGVQVADGARLPSLAIDPSIPLLVLRAVDAPASVLPGRHARRGVVELLAALYSPEHELQPLPHGARIRLRELDDRRLAAGDWLVAPLDPLDNVASPHGLPWIAARLRAPDGCPWDRSQDHASLRRFVLEEAYETVDAIERGTPRQLAEELGDVLLQVVLHAQLAAEVGDFDLTDVYRSIAEKIVRRHPHVFGSVEVDGVDQVARNWENLKSAERTAAGGDAGDAGDGRFDRLSRALPALPASREIQERAAALGWDWPSVDGVWDKVAEELAELRETAPEGRVHELGDVLFALVNLARWMAVDPEEALRAANGRWIERFHGVERIAAARGLALPDVPAAEKDALWEESKALGRAERSGGGGASGG